MHRTLIYNLLNTAIGLENCIYLIIQSTYSIVKLIVSNYTSG